MSTSDEDYEAEAARQLNEKCEHGVLLMGSGPVCWDCENDDSIPEGWAVTPCEYCQTPMGAKCEKGGCCSRCRHSVQPKGRGVRRVMSKHAGKMVPQFYDLETGEAI